MLFQCNYDITVQSYASSRLFKRLRRYSIFIKMAAVCHLVFVKFQFSIFARVPIGCVHHRANFHRDNLNSCADRTFVFFVDLAEKCLFKPLLVGFLGIWPLNGEQCQRDPKRHVLGRKKRDNDDENRSNRATCGRDERTKKTRKETCLLYTSDAADE